MNWKRKEFYAGIFLKSLKCSYLGRSDPAISQIEKLKPRGIKELCFVIKPSLWGWCVYIANFRLWEHLTEDTRRFYLMKRFFTLIFCFNGSLPFFSARTKQ